MKRKMWRVLIPVVLTLTIVACGQQASAGPVLTTGEASPALGGGGGGGWVASNGYPTQGLAVVGTGTANAEPEIARITFGVELRGDDPAALVDEGAKKIDRAIAAVHKLGVAEDDTRTTGYNLWMESIYNPETGVPTGEIVYHLSHHAQATLHNLDQVGEMLAAVVEAGANTISGVDFSVEDPQALLEQARQQALDNAKNQAQQMADVLGINLGKPTLVAETGGGYRVPMEWGVGGGGGGMMDVAAPSVSPGMFSVSISVQIIYEIRE